MNPNRQMIAIHVHYLFDHANLEVNGQVELAWCNPPTQDAKQKRVAPVNRAKLFRLHQLEEMIDFAVEINRIPGQNVYVGHSLRNKGARQHHRASCTDFLASPTIFADCDGEGVLERAEKFCRDQGAAPTGRGITGRHPHVRGQLWWRLTELLRDPVAHKFLTGKIAKVLGSDPAVSDPCRVMRLCGTVAWPVKDGRVEEMTEFSIVAAA